MTPPGPGTIGAIIPPRRGNSGGLSRSLSLLPERSLALRSLLLLLSELLLRSLLLLLSFLSLLLSLAGTPPFLLKSPLSFLLLNPLSKFLSLACFTEGGLSNLSPGSLHARMRLALRTLSITLEAPVLKKIKEERICSNCFFLISNDHKHTWCT